MSGYKSRDGRRRIAVISIRRAVKRRDVRALMSLVGAVGLGLLELSWTTVEVPQRHAPTGILAILLVLLALTFPDV